MKFINKKNDQRGRFFLVKNVQKETSLLVKNVQKETSLLVLILLIGMLIRIIGIADVPNALNCDEASAGYEAFSILNYGIDRNRE